MLAEIAETQQDYGVFNSYERTIIYKKMTIIYNVEGENVIIRRIIPGAIIL
jgi:hypothetical protein